MAGLKRSTLVFLVPLVFGLSHTPAQGDVVLDGSLGPAGALEGPDFKIRARDGKMRGRNLFHSFKRFGLKRGESATFKGPQKLERVISRVTGRKASRINGRIKSEIQGADFYFMNPAGVIFGPGAEVDVGGALHVSTADELRLEDGIRFSAIAPKASSLSVAAPEAFGFIDEQPGNIRLKQNTFLALEEGRSLTLSAGDGSRKRGGDVTLNEGSSIQVPSGDVRLQGRSVVLKDSVVNTSTITLKRAGTITIDADRLSISGTDASESDASFGLFSDASSVAEGGDAGRINVRARSVDIVQGGQIRAVTFSEGDAGTIVVDAGRLGISGKGSSSPTGLFADASSAATGNAGNIRVTATTLELKRGAEIRSALFGSGKAGGEIEVSVSGDLEIAGRGTQGAGEDTARVAAGIVSENQSAEGSRGSSLAVMSGNVRLAGGGKIRSVTFGAGDGGDVDVDARTIQLSGGGQISTSNLGTSRGGSGDLGVRASKAIRIAGEDARQEPAEPSGIFTSAESTSPDAGPGGRLRVSAPMITITNKGEIASETFGGGRGGELTIDADRIRVAGGEITSQAPFDETFAPGRTRRGDAGNLSLHAGSVEVTNGGTISARTQVDGDAGRVKLDSNEVHIERAEISSSTSGRGNAGKIEIRTGILSILEGGRINVVSFASGRPGAIRVVADEITVVGPGEVLEAADLTGMFSDLTRNSTAVAGGTVELKANHMSISGGGEIRSSVFSESGRGSGGRVSVDVAGDLLLDGSATARSAILSEFAESASGERGGEVSVVAGRLIIRERAVIRSITEGVGDAGNVTVSGGSAVVGGGGQISSSALASALGDSGDVTVRLNGPLEVVKRAEDGEPSGIFSSVEVEKIGAGRGGTTDVRAGSIFVADGAELASETFGGGKGGRLLVRGGERIVVDRGEITAKSTLSPGGGDAGSVRIDGTEMLVLKNDGKIKTDAASAAGGNVAIVVSDVAVSESEISTLVGGQGGGGRVLIENPSAVVLDNAVIKTSSVAGRGGDVIITDGVLVRSPGSDINVQGGTPDLDGTVSLGGNEVDLSGDLIDLPITFLIDEQLFDQSCAARSGQPVSSLSEAGGAVPSDYAPPILADRLPEAPDDPPQTQPPETTTGIPVMIAFKCG